MLAKLFLYLIRIPLENKLKYRDRSLTPQLLLNKKIKHEKKQKIRQFFFFQTKKEEEGYGWYTDNNFMPRTVNIPEYKDTNRKTKPPCNLLVFSDYPQFFHIF